MSLVKVPRPSIYLIFSNKEYPECCEEVYTEIFVKYPLKEQEKKFNKFFPGSRLIRVDYTLDFFSIGPRHWMLDCISKYRPFKTSFKVINGRENNENKQINTLYFQEQ